MTESREHLLARALRLSSDIEQIFRDADAWNRRHPLEAPIDIDPDGALCAALHTAREVYLSLSGQAGGGMN